MPLAKLRVQARNLQIGDITGSNERIEGVWRDVRTPSGKVNVKLSRTVRDPAGQALGTSIRTPQWGAYTEINIERPSA